MTLETTISFLRSIGLEVAVEDGASGFLPNVRIDRGALFVDPRCPVSNILHEAGHLACVPASYRSLICGDVNAGLELIFGIVDRNYPHMHPDAPLMRALIQCSDPEATAWAWAAGLRLGLRPELIILDEEYDHTGQEIRSMLAARCYLGINGLAHAGFCAMREGFGLPIYPQLAFWAQNHV